MKMKEFLLMGQRSKTYLETINVCESMGYAKRILFFLGFPNPFPGAAWTRIGFFAKFLRKRGYDVHVIGVFSLFPKGLAKAGSIIYESIPLYNVCPLVMRRNLPAFLFNMIASIMTLTPLFLALKPSSVIISVPTGEPSLGAYIATMLSRAKVLFDYRDEWEDYVIDQVDFKLTKKAYQLLKKVMTCIYRKGGQIFAVTPSVVKRLNARGLREVVLLPNGADTSIFKPYDKKSVRRRLKIRKDDFILLYSGRIEGYYRLEVVLKALVSLRDKHRNIRLLLMGEGHDLQKITKMAQELNLEDKVLYAGVKQNHREVAEIISAGDVGLIPYDDNPLWRNTLPAKFFEYCACGLPVIATVHEDSLLANMIHDHKIGLTSKPMDFLDLANAIKKLKNEEHRLDKGRRARELIIRKFDRNQIAHKFVEAL